MSVPPAAQADGVDPLLVGILQMLWETPEPGWVSLPRLGKRLKASGSEVLRTLQLLSDARIGQRQGLGWVEVRQDALRWQARLNATGRAQCGQLFTDGGAGPAV